MRRSVRCCHTPEGVGDLPQYCGLIKVTDDYHAHVIRHVVVTVRLLNVAFSDVRGGIQPWTDDAGTGQQRFARLGKRGFADTASV